MTEHDPDAQATDPTGSEPRRERRSEPVGGRSPGRRGRHRVTAVARRRIALGVGAALGAIVLVVAVVALVARPWDQRPQCPPIAENPEWSVARRWDEATARRHPPRTAQPAGARAEPLPRLGRHVGRVGGVRPDRVGVLRHGEAHGAATWRRPARRRSATRPTACSPSGTSRPSAASESLSEFDDLMDALCYPLDVTTTEGDSPAAVGNRIAAAVIAAGLADGSRRGDRVRRPDVRAGEPAAHGRVDRDPGDGGPQPLAAAADRAHDLPERHPGDQRRAAGGRAELGPRHAVRPAAGRRRRRADRPRPAAAARRPGDRRAFKEQVVEVIRDSSLLDPASPADDRHLARRPRRQQPRRERRHGPRR